MSLLLLAYPLALLHRNIPTATARHAMALLVGFTYALSIFRADVIHFILSSGVAYLLAKITPTYSPKLVFFWAMAYISYGHIARMYLTPELGGPAVHWTSPQMLLTIKITSFAWAYHDGQKPDDQLLPSQRERAIKKLPSLLQYYSYVFFFPGFLTGPIAEFKEYSDFTDRTLYAKEPNGKIPEGSYSAALVRLVMGLGALPMYHFHQRFPAIYATTDAFRQHSFLYRFGYMLLTGELGFDRYYIAFFLGEGAAILSGLGYNGRDERGRVKWDRVLMIRLLPFKFAQDPTTMAANWNVPSANWLKRYVYIRLLPDARPTPGKRQGRVSRLFGQFFPFFATFFVSAVWHGFYAGYYMFFLSLAFFGAIGKLNRIYLRPFVMEPDGQKGKVPHKQIYDFICWIAMWVGLSYHLMVFRNFTWANGLRSWGSFYFLPHIGGVIWLLAYVVYFSMRPAAPRRDNVKTTKGE